MIKLSFPDFWLKKGFLSYLLLPVSWLFCFGVWLRRLYYKYLSPANLSVPVIVVGNITVGGAGKTPLVVYLVNLLKQQGYRPGVVSRGYGRKSKKRLVVGINSNSEEVGDEPLLIFRRTNCPVVIGSDRYQAARELIEDQDCDVIISDDGLQHYKLHRDIEIAVVDAEFKFGNGFCLPAGPLREPISRLNTVDYIVKNFNNVDHEASLSSEYKMVLKLAGIRKLSNPSEIKNAGDFRGETIHAIAGIGRPDKFFQTLKDLDLNIVEHPFPDHHQFQPVDFPAEDKVVIMTEKDAVKCDRISGDNFWYAEVDAKLSEEFNRKLLKKLKK